MELNSAPVVSYEYDSASRMLQRVEGGTTTNYTWDGWDLIKEVKSGAVNEATNYLVPFGELLAFERGGDFFYLHGDGLSSTQLVTDENGVQVGRFIYGAWGEELYASESVSGILESRFVGGAGCRRDSATGLIYMRHRWYDPALQRFVSRDPIGLRGGPNLYEYAKSNPLNNSDPFGLVAFYTILENAWYDRGRLTIDFTSRWVTTWPGGTWWTNPRIYAIIERRVCGEGGSSRWVPAGSRKWSYKTGAFDPILIGVGKKSFKLVIPERMIRNSEQVRIHFIAVATNAEYEFQYDDEYINFIIPSDPLPNSQPLTPLSGGSDPCQDPCK